MLWSARLLYLTAPTALLTAVSCSQDVLIARAEKTGGAGGTEETGGAGGEAGGDGGRGPREEPARLLADSVADFSLVQGRNGWYYGLDDGSLKKFTLMTKKSVIVAYVPPSKDVWECWASEETHWAQLFRLGGHPNGTFTGLPSVPLLQRSVRRWVSTVEGDIVISGEIAKIDVDPRSNGIDASIYADGALLYSTFIGGDDSGGRAYEVTARIQVGSTLDFVLDPHEGDDHHDLSRFTAIIARAEAPPDAVP